MMREVVINTRAQNRKLTQENESLRLQNFRLRAVLTHKCGLCPEGDACPELVRMTREALDATG
jgi:regulator of replication initiation timing